MALPYETNKPFGVVLFDINGDPVDFGGGGEVVVTNFPESYPLPAEQVTALTPPPAITGFATEARQNDMLAELASIAIEDFATEETLALVLAKLISSPSTEAKQDSMIAFLTSLDGKDFATQTTLAAILAKLIAAPATEAKQDSVITQLTNLNAKDFATQTTLAAILAKLIAAPSTEAKQDDIITLLTALSGFDFGTETTLNNILTVVSALNLVSGNSTTSTPSNVSGTITSTTLLSANSDRKGAAFFNDSTANLFLKCGTTASSTSFTVKMTPNQYFELPFKYTGRIDGVWSAANGAVRITEFT